MLGMVSYYCATVIFVPKTNRFSDIRLQICCDFEDRVRGSVSHWKCHHSIESLWLSIVTMALSCVISEIFSVEKYRDLEIPVKGQTRSLNVVQFDRMGMVWFSSGVHFTILPTSLCASYFYETRHTRSTHRRNHVSQIFSRSVQGLRSSDTPKIVISHWLAASPLQQCSTAVRHCNSN